MEENYEELFDLAWKQFKEMRCENIVSAFDLGDIIVFFEGYEDEYAGVGSPLAVTKSSKLVLPYIEDWCSNWKKVSKGTKLNVPNKYKSKRGIRTAARAKKECEKREKEQEKIILAADKEWQESIKESNITEEMINSHEYDYID